MSKQNSWENQLSRWKGREPSPRIEAELFGGSALTKSRASRSRWTAAWGVASWQWFVPSATALFLAIVALGRNAESFTGFAGLNSTSLVATVAFDQPDMSTYSGTAHHSDANMLPVNVWQRGGPHTSLMTVATSAATNSFE